MDESLDDVAINVRTKSSRRWAGRRLANSPETRAFLNAGKRLVDRELLGELDEDKVTFRPLATLTREGIVREAQEDREALGREPTVAMHRDRWPCFPDFMGDLIRFVLRERHSLTNGMLDEHTRARLSTTPRFSTVVHEVAYHDMRIMHGDPASVRFQYLMTGLADHHEAIRTALGGVYENSFAYWRDQYRAILDARGVTFRPGVTLDEFTVILTGMAEGLGLRHIGANGDRVVDHHRHRTVLGKAAQILIAGAINPGDDRVVESVVDELMAVQVPPPPRRQKLTGLRARVARRRSGRT